MSEQKTKRLCQRDKRKRWHRRNNPKRATFAQHVGTTAKIAEHDAKMVFIASRLAKIQTAEDRELYHSMRLRSLEA